MAAVPLTFTVPDAAAESILKLVASYGACASPVNVSIVNGSSSVEFSDDKGQKLQGLTTACTAIANACPPATQLFGTTTEQQSKVRPNPH